MPHAHILARALANAAAVGNNGVDHMAITVGGVSEVPMCEARDGRRYETYESWGRMLNVPAFSEDGENTANHRWRISSSGLQPRLHSWKGSR